MVTNLKPVLAILGCALLLTACPGQQTAEQETPLPTGDWLGQEPPGDVPQLFAPGVVSTELDELNSIFSPDATEFLFGVKLPDRERHTMLITRREGETWSAPAVLPFSGAFADADPIYSPDGNRIYFISMRPRQAGDERNDWNIWFVDRTEEGWSDPVLMPEPINSDAHEIYPSLTNSGTLYFSSNRNGRFRLHRVALNEPGAEPEMIGETINHGDSEGDTFVDPEERFIIFSANLPEGYGRNDLYISFRLPSGDWSHAMNMGGQINSSDIEYCPAVSPDGAYMFFTSYRRPETIDTEVLASYSDIEQIYSRTQNGLGNIYWISARVIDSLHSQALMGVTQ
jgi:Tol biopolymer transport system component